MRALIVTIAGISAAAWPVAALAHAGAEAGEGWFPLEPWGFSLMAAASLIYLLGFRNMRRRSGTRVATPGAGAAFAAAVGVALAVLTGPLDHLADELFSAHMAQHLTLMLVVAPLLVLARAGMVVFWALPASVRKPLGTWWTHGSGALLQPLLTSPIAIWSWFCGAFVFWHLPGPYEWALRNEAVHILEHLFFVVTAYAFWSIVIEPLGRRRLDYGAALLFVATAAVVSGLPGALMILTSRPLYGGHASGVAEWGLTLVEDQQLGGLIMWIPGGFAYLAAVSMLLFRWLDDAERRALRLRPLAPLLCLLAILPLAGCDAPLARQSGAAQIGDPDRGEKLITSVGCSTCHKIPGIARANGMVGPPLTNFRKRTIIAGMLPNTPDNLVRWLRRPQAVVPGNAMPDIGLSEEDARNIAAYLYTIE